ncbi:MAG TPA: porphobilinogen synthase, partial [Candidatus Methylomirabilis sp.]|nr:porphobilinogen synthase [Candidatus Methylomirabilis sp.]
MAFPIDRPRRLRRNEAIRSFVRETRLSPEGFVYPLFVCPGEGVHKEIRSMPGVFNLSVDEAVKECAEVKSLGIP